MWRVSTKIIAKITGVILVLGAVFLPMQPAAVYAADSPVLVVGIQTGTALSASQEYIELANVSNDTVNLSQAKLEYFSAAPKDLTKASRTIKLQGTLVAGAHYVLATPGFRTVEASQTLSATLAAAGGHLRLSSGSAEWDVVGWGTATASRGQAAPSANEILRRQDHTGMYVNSGNSAYDFGVPKRDAASSSADIISVILSELLPNPASPQTDAKDEYIELYNDGQQVADLTGYKVLAGPSLSRSFTLANITLKPGEFRVLNITETKLSLSNTNNRVQLVSPLGEIVSETAYESAEAGLAWAWDGSSWQWTTKPTPGAENELVARVTSASRASEVKKTPTVPKKKSAVKKTVKAAKASKGRVKGAVTSTPSEQTGDDPKPTMHTGVIAGVGSLAVLYGAYEYRNDVTNFYRKLRRNRGTRGENRQSP